MEEVFEWAHYEVQAYLPDLEINGPVESDDLLSFLSDKYCHTFSEATTKEIREILLLVAKEYVE